MSTNPFKAFIAYEIDRGQLEFNKLDEYESVDPSAGSWRTVGLVPPMPGEALIVDLQGIDSWMTVQFNDRILPGKVRDEELGRRVDKLTELQGRKPSKKEYAEMRDQVEFDLLPKAFIRRTRVEVLFTRFYDKETARTHYLMLVCTSSHKRADDAVLLLAEALGAYAKMNPWLIEPKNSIPFHLTQLALGGPEDLADEADRLVPGSAAVLKATDPETKHVIRIKDKDLEEADIQALLGDPEDPSYRVHEIEMIVYRDDEVFAVATVTDAPAFKRVLMPDVKIDPVKGDLHGFAVLCAMTYKQVLFDFLRLCGGIADRPVPSKPAASTVADDEDF